MAVINDDVAHAGHPTGLQLPGQAIKVPTTHDRIAAAPEVEPRTRAADLGDKAVAAQEQGCGCGGEQLGVGGRDAALVGRDGEDRSPPRGGGHEQGDAGTAQLGVGQLGVHQAAQRLKPLGGSRLVRR